MTYGGGGWKPSSRRNRRRNRAPQRPTEEGADRTFLVLLVVFSLVALGLVLALAVLGN